MVITGTYSKTSMISVAPFSPSADRSDYLADSRQSRPQALRFSLLEFVETLPDVFLLVLELEPVPVPIPPPVAFFRHCPCRCRLRSLRPPSRSDSACPCPCQRPNYRLRCCRSTARRAAAVSSASASTAPVTPCLCKSASGKAHHQYSKYHLLPKRIHHGLLRLKARE
jgi:hypothetical protein